MEQALVLIIGAGAAGLAAAKFLSERGVGVSLLEAPDRLGGRIPNIRSQSGRLPIELGAEFFHGERNSTRGGIRQAKFRRHKGPTPHLQAHTRPIKKMNKISPLIQQV